MRTQSYIRVRPTGFESVTENITYLGWPTDGIAAEAMSAFKLPRSLFGGDARSIYKPGYGVMLYSLPQSLVLQTNYVWLKQEGVENSPIISIPNWDPIEGVTHVESRTFEVQVNLKILFFMLISDTSAFSTHFRLLFFHPDTARFYVPPLGNCGSDGTLCLSEDSSLIIQEWFVNGKNALTQAAWNGDLIRNYSDRIFKSQQLFKFNINGWLPVVSWEQYCTAFTDPNIDVMLEMISQEMRR